MVFNNYNCIIIMGFNLFTFLSYVYRRYNFSSITGIISKPLELVSLHIPMTGFPKSAEFVKIIYLWTERFMKEEEQEMKQSYRVKF